MRVLMTALTHWENEVVAALADDAIIVHTRKGGSLEGMSKRLVK